MKSLYALLLLMAIPFMAFSQSVISNVVPNFGDQFVLNQADFAPSPGQAGANITWDFSNQIIDDFTGNYTVMLPSEVEGSEDFPGATMVWVVDFDGIVLGSYTGFENNTFTEYGTKSEFSGFSSGVNYSDPIDHFTYPLSYQNTGSDTYSGSVFGIGSSNSISGTQSYVVDGWGTIITPYGNFENVLRITHTSIETLQSTLTILTNRTQTSWYSPDYPIPVMIIASDFSSAMGMPLDSSQTMTAMVSYTPASTTGLADRANQNALTIYPNPAADQITVKVDGLPQNSFLKIYAANGKLSKEVNMNGNEKIDVSMLPPGIYIAIMLADGKKYAQKPFSVVR